MPPARPFLLFLVKLTVVVLSLLAPERALGARATDGDHHARAGAQTDGPAVTTNVLVRRRRSRSGTTLRAASAAVGLALRFDVPAGSWTGGRELLVAADMASAALIPDRAPRLLPPAVQVAAGTPLRAAPTRGASSLAGGPHAPRPPPIG